MKNMIFGLVLGIAIVCTPTKSFSQEQRPEMKPLLVIEEQPWTQAKFIIVTAGAFAGGWLSYTIAEALFYETGAMEMGQYVVSDLAEQSGSKSFVMVLGTSLSAFGTSQLYNSYSNEMFATYDDISGAFLRTFDNGLTSLGWLKEKTLTMMDSVSNRSYEMYDYVTDYINRILKN